ncbi:MAG TPA: glycogen debranching enzyme GlgX, partial [Terriglobales bacterium]
HDGFTLQDLVSYNSKHNEANGEDNRDGTDNNRSWNCGVEGPSETPEIKSLRARQKKNVLATLLLSQGVPMLLAGDAVGHTQVGNNNAYCQDNEISWLNWDIQDHDRKLLGFVQRIIKLRKEHPVFRRRSFFQGRRIQGAGVKDILWLTPDGREMTDDEWNQSSARCLGIFFTGESLGESGPRGEPITDDNFLLLINANHEDVAFALPALKAEETWRTVVDTTWDDLTQRCMHEGGTLYQLKARSLALFIEHKVNERRNGS